MPGIAICNSPILSSGMGRYATPPFVVSDTPGTLLWLGSYDPANATLHTQPMNIDAIGRFDADSGWTKGTGWSIGSGVATFNNASATYLTSTSLAVLRYCRYSIAFDVARRASGTVQARFSGYTGTAQSAVGSYTGEWTAAGTTGCLSFLGSAGGNLDIDNVRSFTNKSITTYVPKYRATGLTGALTQAALSAMPYSTGTAVCLVANDFLMWSGATADFKSATDGTGATIISCVTPKVLAAGSQCVGGVGSSLAASIGTNSGYTNANTVFVKVGNGSGVYDLDASAAATVSIDTTYVFTLRIASGANGVTLRQNKVNKLTASLTAPSSSDPSSWGFYSGIGLGEMILHDAYIANRVLTDAEVEAIENDMYLRATGSPMP